MSMKKGWRMELGRVLTERILVWHMMCYTATRKKMTHAGTSSQLQASNNNHLFAALSKPTESRRPQRRHHVLSAPKEEIQNYKRCGGIRRRQKIRRYPSHARARRSRGHFRRRRLFFGRDEHMPRCRSGYFSSCPALLSLAE